MPEVKLTKAQLRVLGSHLAVDPRPVGWSYLLCRYQTWESLYGLGLLHAGKLTPAGRAALATGSPDAQ